MRRGVLTLVTLPLLVNACATLAHGSEQVVPVVADVAGAKVSVDGVALGEAPLLASVSRSGHHVITVTHDSFPARTIPLSRFVSPWVAGNLFAYLVPIAVDFANGAAYVHDPDTVRASFRGADTGGAAMRWNPAAGARLRFLASDSANVIEGVVDSTVTGRAFLRPRDAAPGQMPRVVEMDEMRGAAVYVGRDRTTNALRVMGRTQRILFPLAFIPYGALIPIFSLPVGFAAGYAADMQRWAPLESFRSGAALAVDDRLRISVKGNGATTEVDARLIGVERGDLVVEREAMVTRVARDDVVSLHRQNGLDYARGLVRAVMTGAVVGAALSLTEGVRTSRPVMFTTTTAVVGAIFTPAFAPTRWDEVRRW